MGSEAEPELLGFVRSFCAFLVAMPGNPDPKKGPFYLIKGLLKVLDDFPWGEGSTGQVCIWRGVEGVRARFGGVLCDGVTV